MIDENEQVYIYHTQPDKYDKNGEVVEKCDLNYQYRATIALRYKDDGTLWVGIALCSPLDRFKRKVGIQKALGRSKSRYAIVVEKELGTSDRGEIVHIIKEAINNVLRKTVMEMAEDVESSSIFFCDMEKNVLKNVRVEIEKKVGELDRKLE